LTRVVEYFYNSNVEAIPCPIPLGRETASILLNMNSTQEVSFGSSSSLLIENLAKSIEGDFGDESEIIVTGELVFRPLEMGD
jgi:selenocysteine lyase/cysteine desulfurase